jgi:ATP-dependent RNA helicase DHX8/PRP22
MESHEEDKHSDYSEQSSPLNMGEDIGIDKIMYDKPCLKYREERKHLPIYEKKTDIVKTICENLFCIVTGETGSGKTTQIPQYVVDEIRMEDIMTPLPEAQQRQYPFECMKTTVFNYRDRKLRCVVTQPRRVAAIQMAKRVSYESGVRMGYEVGYTIRFEDNSTPDTNIKYVTDGILVRECLMDADLKHYDVVILDEAHERSMYTDILFSLVKQAVIRRKGTLRLVVTSATLQTEMFSKFFFNCPIIEASGRCYPVKVMYIESHPEKRLINSVKAAIRIHLHEGPGDVLVFLTGFEE